MYHYLNRKNFIFYALTLLIAFFLKAFFSNAATDDLNLILHPTSQVVNAITASSFEYVVGKGYAMEGSSVVINKTCSGINFFIIAFTMAAFMGIAAFENIRGKIWSLILCVGCGFVLTVLVNGFRISAAIFFLERFHSFDFITFPLSHHVQGILFYFSFLVIYFIGVRELIRRKAQLQQLLLIRDGYH